MLSPSTGAANACDAMDAVSTAPSMCASAYANALAQNVARTMRDAGCPGASTSATRQMHAAIGQMHGQLRIITDFPSCYYRSMCHNRSAFL